MNTVAETAHSRTRGQVQVQVTGQPTRKVGGGRAKEGDVKTHMDSNVIKIPQIYTFDPNFGTVSQTSSFTFKPLFFSKPLFSSVLSNYIPLNPLFL